MRKRLLSLAVAGSTAGFFFLGLGNVPAAHAACPPSELYDSSTASSNADGHADAPGTVQPVGPITIYSSGSGAPSPGPSASQGYVGVAVAGQGYVEANGDEAPLPGSATSGSGYIVASNGTSGLLIQGVPPAVPPTC